jgi:PBP1b-binding outer membrane lipoprotein LpoB
MKKIVLALVVCLFFTGCSNFSDGANSSLGSNNSNTPNPIDWDINGYVIDTQEGALLIAWNITDKDIENKSVQQILEIAKPKAAWISSNETNRFEIGDKVFVKTTGVFDQSFPAQGEAVTVEQDHSTSQ